MVETDTSLYLTNYSFVFCTGIPPHVDTHSAFEDEIISLSLGAEVMYIFLLGLLQGSPTH